MIFFCIWTRYIYTDDFFHQGDFYMNGLNILMCLVAFVAYGSIQCCFDNDRSNLELSRKSFQMVFLLWKGVDLLHSLQCVSATDEYYRLSTDRYSLWYATYLHVLYPDHCFSYLCCFCFFSWCEICVNQISTSIDQFSRSTKTCVSLSKLRYSNWNNLRVPTRMRCFFPRISGRWKKTSLSADYFEEIESTPNEMIWLRWNQSIVIA